MHNELEGEKKASAEASLEVIGRGWNLWAPGSTWIPPFTDEERGRPQGLEGWLQSLSSLCREQGLEPTPPDAQASDPSITLPCWKRFGNAKLNKETHIICSCPLGRRMGDGQAISQKQSHGPGGNLTSRKLTEPPGLWWCVCWYENEGPSEPQAGQVLWVKTYSLCDF